MLVNGDDISLHRTSVGYVPQHEVVHGKLTVREALRYSARLRLPEDTTAAEIDETCARVMAELGLEEHAGTRVERLSGGQRRRVGVGLELLSRPSLLFLDEPTTGLDPGLEARLMALFRDLADPSRAVVIVTHATASLALCDELVVMGAGGVLCFQGAPAEALRFFGVETLRRHLHRARAAARGGVAAPPRRSRRGCRGRAVARSPSRFRAARRSRRRAC